MPWSHERDPRADGKAFWTGVVSLALISVVYGLVADETARPLAVFALPGLLTAVVGGWRPTVGVGGLSLVVATAYGVAEPLSGPALLARLLVVVAGVGAAAVGSLLRERQSVELADLGQTTDVLQAFEHGLAPVPHPPPHFVSAVRYAPAEARMQLGGDFLDAITLTDSRLGFVIGDVSGHGPDEAALGAAMRAAWKAIALSDKSDPASWIEALQHTFFSQERHQHSYVTVCTGYLDRRAEIVRAAVAGHPRPLVLGSRPRPMPLPVGPPIAAEFFQGWESMEVAWRGEPLLLYTDGLLDNPDADGRRPHWQEEDLLRWLGGRPAAGVGIVDELLAEARAREALDDVALLYLAGGDP